LRQLKFTIGLTEIPTSLKFFHEQKYADENHTLKEAMAAYQPDISNPVRLFDRGISARQTYDDLTGNNIPFITRLNKNNRQEIVTENSITEPIETDSLIITSDNWVTLIRQNP
jgi:hypothetical protein